MHILNNPRKFVSEYFKRNEIFINKRGELEEPKGKNPLQIFDQMFLDYLMEIKIHNEQERKTIKADSEGVLKKAFQEYIDNFILEKKRNILESLKCQKQDLSELIKFVKGCTGKEDENDISVMAHWIWQVKMKMNKKDPVNHIMPILYSKRQGGGKSTAINLLLEIIECFRLNFNLVQVTDERYFKAMSENYVVVLDEMGKAEKADMEIIKNQISIPYNDPRNLGTNTLFKAKQQCSFIGASNKTVAELMVDPTGMRRFWQLECSPVLDWKLINSLDYLKLWKGVDENKKDGYIIDRIKEITEKQKELVTQDEISFYLQSRGILNIGGITKKLTSEELYLDYKNWAPENGYKPMNNSWFGRKLTSHGLKRNVVTVYNHTYNCYEINENALLDSQTFS